MKFTCEITCDNAAFDGDCGGMELRKILVKVGDLVADTAIAPSGGARAIHDSNGNRVGAWSISD